MVLMKWKHDSICKVKDLEHKYLSTLALVRLEVSQVDGVNGKDKAIRGFI